MDTIGSGFFNRHDCRPLSSARLQRNDFDFVLSRLVEPQFCRGHREIRLYSECNLRSLQRFQSPIRVRHGDRLQLAIIRKHQCLCKHLRAGARTGADAMPLRDGVSREDAIVDMVAVQLQICRKPRRRLWRHGCANYAIRSGTRLDDGGRHFAT